MNNTIPEQYTKMVGTKIKASGGLFSSPTRLPEHEYDVLNIRRGTARIVNTDEIRKTGKSSVEHPTYELLLKRPGMKRAQWTKPFPIREVNLANTEYATFT
mgnify:CR=1 FL=1